MDIILTIEFYQGASWLGFDTYYIDHIESVARLPHRHHMDNGEWY